MPGQVHVHKEPPLGWIVFDHPERRNALSVSMWEAMPAAAEALASDPAVRVVILRGAGEAAFVSGADISQFEQARSGSSGAGEYEDLTDRAFGAFAALEKPVLAMIHGFCIGGGLAVALTADLRIGAEDALLGIPAARLGLGYGADGIAKLASLVGPSRAKEVLFTARRFAAADALRMGLLNQVHPKAELEGRVRELALEIAANAPLTLRSVKRVIRALGQDPAQRDGAGIEASIRACFESEDYREGVRAFLEKRTPRFQGK
jgi:enoyl-CoA hydratase/carnithine racemase